MIEKKMATSIAGMLSAHRMQSVRAFIKMTKELESLNILMLKGHPHWLPMW